MNQHRCCCCIPLFGNKYKDIIHKCPRCKKEVGIKEYECVWINIMFTNIHHVL
jgi:hypothetical protein